MANDVLERIRNKFKKDDPTVSLDNLTDKQKMCLTKLSYLDIDVDAYNEFKNEKGEVKVSDLVDLLENPNDTLWGRLGNLGSMLGWEVCDETDKKVLEEALEEGLGYYTIKDVLDDKNSGAQGLAFEDPKGNTGVSFRGTDVSNLGSLFKDVATDISLWLRGEAGQLDRALEFFNKNSDMNGNNYLFGHSLGGYLAESTLAENHEYVKHCTVVNPLHVESENLDTQEKVDAFNDPNKLTVYDIGGDSISQITQPELFEDNITYVKNSLKHSTDGIWNHLPTSGKFDSNGNYLTEESKDEAYKDCGGALEPNLLDFAESCKKNFPALAVVLKETFMPMGWLAEHLYVGFHEKLPEKLGEIRDGVENTMDGIGLRIEGLTYDIKEGVGNKIGDIKDRLSGKDKEEDGLDEI